MEGIFFTIIISLCIFSLLKSLFQYLTSSSSSKHTRGLPPGPHPIVTLCNLLWLRGSIWDIESFLRNVRHKHGPVFALTIPSRAFVFIADHSLARQALLQCGGAALSDRPKASPSTLLFSSISSAALGPTWGLLRRNLTSHILHPSRHKSFSAARNRVLGSLVQRLLCHENSAILVQVGHHFRHAMFYLLAIMCFGDQIEHRRIEDIERVQRKQISSFGKFNIFSLLRGLGRVLLRKRWEELLIISRNQEDVLVPLIEARLELVERRRQRQQQEGGGEEEEEMVAAYVDTLAELELPEEEEKRKVEMGEMVSLCSEFLNAGTDTTSTAIEWIMANLVKYPDLQEKLYNEIR